MPKIIIMNVGIDKTFLKFKFSQEIINKATICWNHVFHQKFPKMVCGRADHYHYPLYVLKDF